MPSKKLGKQYNSKSEFKPFPTVKCVVGTLFGGLVLYLLFKRVSPLVVLLELARVDKVKLMVAVVFIAFSYVCRAVIWRKLLHQFKDYPYGAVFRSTMIGYLVNNLLPARLGDVTRGVWLHQTQGGNSSFIFGSLALERVMDISVILALLGVSVVWLRLYYNWLVFSAAMLGLLVFVFFGTAAALKWLAQQDSHFLPAPVVKIKKWISRFALFSNPRSVVANLGHSMSIGNVRRGAVWSVTTWFVTFWGLYFALDSLDLTQQIGLLQTALILCIASLGIAVPSLPASVGTYQAAFIFGAMLVGVPETKALSASFLYQGLWVTITSLLGLVSLVWEEAGFKKLLTRIKSVQHNHLATQAVPWEARKNPGISE